MTSVSTSVFEIRQGLDLKSNCSLFFETMTLTWTWTRSVNYIILFSIKLILLVVLQLRFEKLVEILRKRFFYNFWENFNGQYFKFCGKIVKKFSFGDLSKKKFIKSCNLKKKNSPKYCTNCRKIFNLRKHLKGVLLKKL